MTKESHPITIFNVFGHLNSGDAALLESLLDLLRNYYPDEAISGITFDPLHQSRWSPEVAWSERIGNPRRRSLLGRVEQIAILIVAYLCTLSRVFLPLARFFPASQQESLLKLQRAGIAFSCPGGYLEDSNKAYLINCIGILLACKYAKTVILAPQSIGPIKSAYGRWLIRRILWRVDYVFVREQESLTFVNQAMGNAEAQAIAQKVKVVGDLAFWYFRKPQALLDLELSRLAINPERKLLGLSVVDWNFPGIDDPDSAKQRYKDSLCQLIEHVNRKGTHQIVIFNQVATDLSFAKSIGKLLPYLIVDTFERDSALYSKLIGMCDVFVGTRFHSCIFALLEAVPTTAIGYLPKTAGVMRDLGLGDSVIDITEVSGEKLISQFEYMSKNRPFLSASIVEKILRYRATNDAFIQYLSNGGNLGSLGLDQAASSQDRFAQASPESA